MMAERHLNHIRRPMTDDDILFTNMLVRGLTFLSAATGRFIGKWLYETFLE